MQCKENPSQSLIPAGFGFFNYYLGDIFFFRAVIRKTAIFEREINDSSQSIEQKIYSKGIFRPGIQSELQEPAHAP
jgi:hypothetical protein